MESLATETFRTLATQGTGWLLFVLVSVGLILAVRELLKAKDDCRTIQEAAQKATELAWRERLQEREQSLTAMNAQTAANTKLAETLQSMRPVNDALGQLVQQMDRDLRVNDTHWRAWSANIDRILQDILNRLDRRPP